MVKDLNLFVKKQSNRKIETPEFAQNELPVSIPNEGNSSIGEKRALIDNIQKDLEGLTTAYLVHRRSMTEIQKSCQRVFKDISKELNIDIGQNYTPKPKLQMPTPQKDYGSLGLVEEQEDEIEMILPHPSLLMRHDELGDNADQSVLSIQPPFQPPSMMAAAK